MDPKTIRVWKSKISCSDSADDLLLYTSFSKRKLYEALTSVDEVNRTGCQLLFVSPKKQFNNECRLQHIPITQTCSENWRAGIFYDPDVEKACGLYTALFMNTYKNVFCYLCNTDRMVDLQILIMDTSAIPEKAVTGRLTFSALVNFDDSYTVGNPENELVSETTKSFMTSTSLQIECKKGQIHNNSTVCTSIRFNA